MAETEFVPSIDEPSGEGFGDTPLLDFWADGCGWQLRSGTSRAGNPWQRVNFKFTNLDVIESTEPYIYPTGEVSLFYSDPARTPKKTPGQGTNDWEVWAESVRNFTDLPEGNPLDVLMGGRWRQPGDEANCPGMRMHWKKVDSLIRVGPDRDAAEGTPEAEWRDVTRPAWQVVEIQGLAGTASAGGTDIYTFLVGLADGKTEVEFKQAGLSDQQVMSKPEIVQKFTDNSIVSELEALGKITRAEDGKLHKV